MTKTFLEVMREMPFEALWTLLNSPGPVNESGFEVVIAWCRPKVTAAITFTEAVLDSGLLATRSEVYRKVKEGVLKWNGYCVSDPNMPIEFLHPGWAVIQLGKKTHRVLTRKESA